MSASDRRINEQRMQAERDIAAILEQLEQATGQLVREVGLYRVDASKLADEGPRHLMSVVIDLHRLPGHLWKKA